MPAPLSQRLLLLTWLALWLAGCSNIPETISDAPPGDPTLGQVRAEPEKYQGAEVRWGGTIYKIDNLEEGTRMEIIARRLYGNGEPRNEDSSSGRFIALFDHFIDPAIYTINRTITVHGHVVGSEEGKVGNYPYQYPIVQTDQHRLWPEPRVSCPECDPFYRDPWWPYYGYPYYGYPYRPWPYYPPR